MKSSTQVLLKEVHHQKVQNETNIVLVYIPSLGTEKSHNHVVQWKSFIPKISAFDTRVFTLRDEVLCLGSFAHILARSKSLLRELFTAYLGDQMPYPSIVFICDGVGGLFVKEAIASIGEDLNMWQKRLNSISCIVFLRTPHIGDIQDTYGTDPWQIPRHHIQHSPNITLTPEVASQLHLSAEQFARTFEHIDWAARVLSGYELPLPKKPILKRMSTRSRLKVMVIDKARATIGLTEEHLAPMDKESNQIMNPAYDCSFRREIAHHIRKAVEDYQNFIQYCMTLSPIICTPEPSATDSISIALRTPSRSSGQNISPGFNSADGSAQRSPDLQKQLRLPFVFPSNFTHQRSTHFQPRVEVAAAMERALLPSQQQSRSSPSLNLLTFLITGLGGVGKTEVAREFAITNKHHFDVILFLVADHRERLSQKYSEVALSLGLVQTRQVPDLEEDREKLKAWLENPVKNLREPAEIPNRLQGNNEDKAKWLLILDNADNPLVLNDFWPVSGFGSVIVTSRDPSLRTQHFPFADGLALEGLPIPDAVALLKVISRNSQEEDESNTAAEHIVKRLEGLPLAIVQIGSIIMRRALSLKDFTKDYTDTSHYHKLYEERGITNGYEHCLGSVWAFGSIEAEDESALSLLSVLSMLDPAHIQEEVILCSLGEGAVHAYPSTKRDYNDALARLIERSMAQKDRDTGSLQLHRLVQDVARARIAKSLDDLTAAFDLACRSVSSCFPFRDQEMNTAGSVHRWQRCSAMYPHVVQLAEVAKEILGIHRDIKFQLEFVDLLYEASWWQCERREAIEALPLAELGSRICDSLSVQLPDEAGLRTALKLRQTKIWACQNIASKIIGDAKTAFVFSQRRFQAAQDEYMATGIITPFQTATHNDLGHTYAMNRLHDKAIFYLERSVELRKQMPKFKKDWLYSPYYHMGITYHLMGRFSDAESVLQAAVTDREEALGANDRVSHRTGALYYALGNLRMSQGQLDEAYALHHRAYLQCRGTVGESGLPTLRCSQKLAEHYERHGYDVEARNFCQKILDICGKRVDRKREVCQAAFLLSRVQERQGSLGDFYQNQHKAAQIHNNLRPECCKDASELTWEDVKSLIYYDYF